MNNCSAQGGAVAGKGSCAVAGGVVHMAMKGVWWRRWGDGEGGESGGSGGGGNGGGDGDGGGGSHMEAVGIIPEAHM
jgi:hypothetical protein